ncbi:M20/M25/M40 family metallo-hydrolase [Phenylobacterium sp. VNQ135]|uniref:M20/M25/M40 family metallo-hydrolase n=1 Tax=Phenylobacterium sp. VNQ135 TaxID=3400922 RepID=UPI003C03AAD9
MRNLALMTVAAASMLAAAAPAAAQDLAASAAAVRDKALTDGTAWSIAESLTTEIGPRLVGSPAMDRAKDWAVETFKAQGFQNVKVETFTASGWFRGEESAEVVGPYPHKLHILGLGRSTSTPKGGLTAEVALFRSFDELMAQPEGALKGKIAVVTGVMTKAQDGAGYGAINAQRSRGPAEAAKRGAVAYLARSLSTDDTRLPHTGGAAPGGIPAAALSTPDADLLEHLVARGKPVRVKLDMTSRYDAKVPAYNISGEIPGTDPNAGVLIVGGHLDSWDPGTGAVDDAAGIAITTAAVKLAASQGPLKRTLRVVMWGSEEQGGSSDAYLAAHKDEVAQMVVVGESDTGAGRIWQVRLPKGSVDHPAMQAFRGAIAPLKVIVSRETPRFGGADVSGIIGAGAPFVEFDQDATRYFDLHHSADDTLDKIDPAELSQNVAVWGAFLHAAANSDIDFRALAAKP